MFEKRILHKNETKFHRGYNNKQKMFYAFCSRFNSEGSKMHANCPRQNSMIHFEYSNLRTETEFQNKIFCLKFHVRMPYTFSATHAQSLVEKNTVYMHWPP